MVIYSPPSCITSSDTSLLSCLQLSAPPRLFDPHAVYRTMALYIRPCPEDQQPPFFTGEDSYGIANAALILQGANGPLYCAYVPLMQYISAATTAAFFFDYCKLTMSTFLICDNHFTPTIVQTFDDEVGINLPDSPLSEWHAMDVLIIRWSTFG